MRKLWNILISVEPIDHESIKSKTDGGHDNVVLLTPQNEEHHPNADSNTEYHLKHLKYPPLAKHGPNHEIVTGRPLNTNT